MRYRMMPRRGATVTVFRGFGQDDGGAVLDADPNAEVPATPDGEPVVADVGSHIDFATNGMTIVVGNAAAEWWDGMGNALAVAPEARTRTSLLEAAKTRVSSFWKWAALIGIPLAGAAAFYGGRKTA